MSDFEELKSAWKRVITDDDFTAAIELYHSSQDQMSDGLIGEILNWTVSRANMRFFKFLFEDCKIDPEKNWFVHEPLLHWVTSYGWLAYDT